MSTVSKFISLLSFMFIFSAGVNATTCQWINGYSYITRIATFNNVYVQRDTPAGTTLATIAFAPIATSNAVHCSGGVSGYYREYVKFTTKTSLNGVWQTNIYGIGLRIKASDTGIASDNLTSISWSSSDNSNWMWGHGTTFELVKLYSGAVGAGQISSGKIVQGTMVDTNMNRLMSVFEMDIGYANIIPVTCSITTSNLTFPIGDVPVNKFGTSVGTIPGGAQSTQNLGLNCNPGANINASLNGIQNPDVSNTSVLTLTNQGNNNVAKGVGVQLLYNGTQMTLGQRIIMKHSSGGQETFPLTARYYQTQTSVTAGKANASATLDLTYQ